MRRIRQFIPILALLSCDNALQPDVARIASPQAAVVSGDDQSEVVAGPFVVTRETGGPTTVRLPFEVVERGAYEAMLTIRVRDVSKQGRVSSARVSLNGTQLWGLSSFPLKGGEDDVRVDVSENGVIEVTLGGKPGTAVDIVLIGRFRPGFGRVGPGGAVIRAADETIELDVPPGALETGTILGVEVFDSPSDPNPKVAEWIGPLIHLTPDGTTFREDVTLRFNAGGSGQDPARIQLGLVTNLQQGDLDLFATEPVNGWAEGAIRHFSWWTFWLPAPLPESDYTYGVTDYLSVDPSRFDQEVSRGFAQWAYHLSPAGYTFAPFSTGDGSTADILIEISHATGGDAGRTYFVCSWRHDCTQRGIRINLNQNNVFTDDYFAYNGSPPVPNPASYLSTLTHEVGHVLGLTHHLFLSPCGAKSDPVTRPECYEYESGDVMAPFGGTLDGGPQTLSCKDLRKLASWYDVDDTRCAADIEPTLGVTDGERRARIMVPPGGGGPDLLPAVRVVDGQGRPVGGVTVAFVGPSHVQADRTVLGISTSSWTTGEAMLAAVDHWPGSGVETTIDAVLVGPGQLADYRRKVITFVLQGAPEPSGPAKIAFLSERSGLDIWLMDEDGLNQMRLTNVPGTHHDFADWSPDGRRLALSCHAPGPQDDICVINADGTGYQRFDTPWRDGEPRWSPDGTKLLFYSERNGNADIFMMDAETGTQVSQVFASPGPDYHAQWSPDGTKIAFTTTMGTGNYDVYVLELASGALTRITTDPEQDVVPAWSPDGQRLAFASQRTGSSEIWLSDANATESGLVRLTYNAAQPRSNTRPSWSPDGKWLAFASNVHTGSAYDVFKLLVADPSVVVNLSHNAANDEGADWGPPGSATSGRY